MKKLTLKMTALTVFVTVLATSVFAAEVPKWNPDYANSSVVATGKAAENEDFVLLQVYKYGKSFDTVSNKGDILWQDQVAVDENGTYEFNMEFNPGDITVMGYYNAYILSDVKGSGVKLEGANAIPLVGSTAYTTEMDRLNAYADAGDYANFERTLMGLGGRDGIQPDAAVGFSPLGFDLKLLTQVKAKGGTPLSEFMNFVKNNHLTIANLDAVKKKYTNYILIEALKYNDVVENINDDIAASSVKDESVYSDYIEYITDETKQKALTQKLKNAKPNTYAKLVENVKMGIVLTVAQYGDWGELRDVLGTYGTLISGEGIVVNGDAKDKVYQEIVGSEYVTGIALRTAYAAAVKKYSGSAEGGSNAGGGGGGGTNTGTKYEGTYEEPIVAEQTKPETFVNTFTDIEGVPWASESILALAHKNIINGKDEKHFAPDDFITREEFVKIVVGALGYANDSYINIFADVKDSDWYVSFVNIANKRGIVKGMGNGIFGVGENITRQDMVVMLRNALKAEGVELPTGDVSFDDKHMIADYAVEAVGTLNKLGIVNGVSSTQFDPAGNATRAQAAKVVYGIMQLLQ